MAGPTTTFDADECQALLDWIDKLDNAIDDSMPPDPTDEEVAALSKLREAGKFYVR